MISLRNVTGGYTKQTAIVHDLSFTVEKGSFFALLGPNGSGKTTIIRLIMGALSLHSGDILIDGKSISKYKAKELAKKVAVMTQENEVGLDFTVQEIVNLGRYPHQSSILFKENNEHDDKIVEQAMIQTNITYMKDQPFSSLSGGEKQRVLLAKALAQEPSVLLLDEPTNHLDVRHTIELLDLLKQLQLNRDLTILAILHDLNIASLYADKIGLLRCGHLEGTYDGFDKQDEKEFSSVYGVDMHFQAHPQLAKNQVFLLPQYTEQSTLEPVVTGSHTLQFANPLRTLSVGTYGKGITWENQWYVQYGIDKQEQEQGITLSGEVSAYAYEFGNDDYFSLDMEKIEKTNWHALLLFVSDGQKLQLSFLAKAQLSDVDQMNLSIQMASLKTELELEAHHRPQILDLLTVSAVHDDPEPFLFNYDQTLILFKSLFQFAWKNERIRLQV